MSTPSADQAKRFRAKWRAIAHSSEPTTTTPSSTSLLSMPYEILASICEECTQGTIFDIALVCRGLRRVATDSLFVAPVLGSWASGKGFRDAVDAGPLRLVLTRQLTCYAWTKWLPWFATRAPSRIRNLVAVHLANEAEAFDEVGCFEMEGAEPCFTHRRGGFNHLCADCHDGGDCECLWAAHGEPPRAGVPCERTMGYLVETASVVAATFVNLELELIAPPTCDTLQSLTLTELGLYPYAPPQTLKAIAKLGASLPGLRRLVLQLATGFQEAVHYRLQDTRDLHGRPTFNAHHFDSIATSFRSVRDLTVQGPSCDIGGASLKQALHLREAVNIALRDHNYDDDYLQELQWPCPDDEETYMGPFSAEPVLQTMPNLRTLVIRLEPYLQGAFALFDRIASGDMPQLRYVEIYSVPWDAKAMVSLEAMKIRECAATRLATCGFEVQVDDASSRLRGWRTL